MNTETASYRRVENTHLGTLESSIKINLVLFVIGGRVYSVCYSEGVYDVLEGVCYLEGVSTVSVFRGHVYSACYLEGMSTASVFWRACLQCLRVSTVSAIWTVSVIWRACLRRLSF
jgi:hypothetical protein